jgi:hypothetical protein
VRGLTAESDIAHMPRLLKRQEAPIQGRVVGRAPGCIACGNRRTFWVRRGDEDCIAFAWDIRHDDKVVACGRCRSRNSVLFDTSEA